jgi:hypothetical protein
VVTHPLRWLDDERELSPFLTALEDVTPSDVSRFDASDRPYRLRGA